MLGIYAPLLPSLKRKRNAVNLTSKDKHTLIYQFYYGQ
ncbi:hypothetical protein PNIG_a3727 [Pseudoalteromonas nigrifaciens]|uniref:Uncharacterized protein n=1 Tax=Pseudoalteromonas nigrifaciens TaxID=28109 RepID=A0AAC9UMW7_9GAMM|nr:hypothetical protein PNIG_a3727 [Pseudoalteromonas nigrifaciens]